MYTKYIKVQVQAPLTRYTLITYKNEAGDGGGGGGPVLAIPTAVDKTKRDGVDRVP